MVASGSVPVSLLDDTSSAQSRQSCLLCFPASSSSSAASSTYAYGVETQPLLRQGACTAARTVRLSDGNRLQHGALQSDWYLSRLCL